MSGEAGVWRNCLQADYSLKMQFCVVTWCSHKVMFSAALLQFHFLPHFTMTFCKSAFCRLTEHSNCLTSHSWSTCAGPLIFEFCGNLSCITSCTLSYRHKVNFVFNLIWLDDHIYIFVLQCWHVKEAVVNFPLGSWSGCFRPHKPGAP